MGLLDYFKKMVKISGGSSNDNACDVQQTEITQRSKSEESLQKLTNGLGHMLEQLEGINDNLERQLLQNEKLIDKIDGLPAMLSSFPDFVEAQKRTLDCTVSQIKESAERDKRFLETLKTIPEEAKRQSEMFGAVKDQLLTSEETHGKMLENFFKFNSTLEDLNSNSMDQNESLMQMSRAFASSERYFKFMFEKQTKRLVWFLGISLAACLFMLLLAGSVVFYLMSKS